MVIVLPAQAQAPYLKKATFPLFTLLHPVVFFFSFFNMDPKQSEKSVWILRGLEGSKITSQTPQKTIEPPPTKRKLPERFEILVEFFDKMTCSLRLLNLCKKSPTFQNVSSQVEILTKRKFVYRNLAQIKYILPEAIQIDKILVHDKKTLCMKPDMKITLLLDGINVHPEQSRFMALRELFVSRLEDFVSSHPETSDVPEATLLELLNQNLKTENTLEVVDGGSAIQSQSISEVVNLVEVSSPLKHFRKHFSEKIVLPDSERTSLLASQSPSLPSMPNQVVESRHEKYVHSVCPEPETLEGQAVKSEQDELTPEGFPGFIVSSNSCQLTNSGPSAGSVACESPAVKASSSTEILLIETPAQLTPKRAIPEDDNYKIYTYSEQFMPCHKPTKRSLKFCVEGDDSEQNSSMDESESGGHIPSSIDDETLPMAESSIATSGAVPHKEMSSCLPGTIAIIDDIFRAVGCSSITKEELVHKILINDYDIVERREAEEQVELLEKLVPDWIRSKSTPSGDIIYSIKKVSNIESVLSRLISA